MNTTDRDFINNVPRETIRKLDVIGWTGSAFMLVFSLTFFVPLAIVGLILLTIQAKKAKMENIVILNLLSILGFTYSFLGGL